MEASETKAVEEKKDTTVAAEMTEEEAEIIEKAMFEDDAEVRLRDGKTYKLMPFCLQDGIKFMKKLKVLNTEVIMLNLLEDEEGSTSEDALYEVLLLAFKYNALYSWVDRAYLGKYCDLIIAKNILDILLGLNSIVTSKK